MLLTGFEAGERLDCVMRLQLQLDVVPSTASKLVTAAKPLSTPQELEKNM
jgi:hypothetical protein